MMPWDGEHYLLYRTQQQLVKETHNEHNANSYCESLVLKLGLKINFSNIFCLRALFPLCVQTECVFFLLFFSSFLSTTLKIVGDSFPKLDFPKQSFEIISNLSHHLIVPSSVLIIKSTRLTKVVHFCQLCLLLFYIVDRGRLSNVDLLP